MYNFILFDGSSKIDDYCQDIYRKAATVMTQSILLNDVPNDKSVGPAFFSDNSVLSEEHKAVSVSDGLRRWSLGVVFAMNKSPQISTQLRHQEIFTFFINMRSDFKMP